MTKYNLMDLSETGRWFLLELLATFTQDTWRKEKLPRIQIILNGDELGDINPTIKFMASAIDAAVEKRAIAFVVERLDGIDENISEFVLEFHNELIDNLRDVFGLDKEPAP